MSDQVALQGLSAGNTWPIWMPVVCTYVTFVAITNCAATCVYVSGIAIAMFAIFVVGSRKSPQAHQVRDVK